MTKLLPLVASERFRGVVSSGEGSPDAKVKPLRNGAPEGSYQLSKRFARLVLALVRSDDVRKCRDVVERQLERVMQQNCLTVTLPQRF